MTYRLDPRSESGAYLTTYPVSEIPPGESVTLVIEPGRRGYGLDGVSVTIESVSVWEVIARRDDNGWQVHLHPTNLAYVN